MRDAHGRWPGCFVPALSAYSCLAVLPDGSIGCLYEAGQKHPYEKLVFARFPLEWLTESPCPLGEGQGDGR